MRASSSLDVKGGTMNEWERLAGAKPLTETLNPPILIAKAILVGGLVSGANMEELLDLETATNKDEAEIVCIGQQLYAESLGLT